MKKFTLIFFIIILIFSFSLKVFAQSSDGTVTGTTPPTTDPTLSPADPATSDTSTTPTNGAGSTPVSTPANTGIVKPKTVTPKSPAPAVIIPTSTSQPDADQPSAETSSNSSTLIITAGALAAGVLGFFGLRAQNKKIEDKKNDKKCLNIKKLMEKKLDDLTDLKGKLESLAKEQASKQIKGAVRGTTTENLIILIENGKKEYERLKELYEKCITEFEKKKKVLIFHGTEGYPEENWFPWLKEKIEAKGFKAFVPQFSSPPIVPAKLPEWFEVLKNYEKHIDEDTIIVGHSLGGTFTLKFLEQLKHPVKAVFFVGAAIGIKPIINYERDLSFSGFDFDWDIIKDKAEHFIVFHSDNDPYVDLENGRELAKKLGVQLSFIPSAGHFNEKAGYTKFEELWEKLEPLLGK